MSELEPNRLYQGLPRIGQAGGVRRMWFAIAQGWR
jgi:hypothetical protein